MIGVTVMAAARNGYGLNVPAVCTILYVHVCQHQENVYTMVI